MNFRKVVIFAAHPDDEVLGCGGTMINLIRRGTEVHVVYLTSGDSRTEDREIESTAVCQLLGVSSHSFLRLNKNGLGVSEASLSAVLKILNKIKPDAVFVSHDQDGDFDHMMAYQIVMGAYWRHNEAVDVKHKARALIMYEIHKPMQSYSVIEDISSVIDQKMAAMRLYKTQIANSHIDYAIQGLNCYRGLAHQGYKYAEVFQLRKVTDFFS